MSINFSKTHKIIETHKIFQNQFEEYQIIEANIIFYN